MNTAHVAKLREAGYLLPQALVYIFVIFILLGVGYAAMYRAMRNSVQMRRTAEDISSAVQVGERWRADVRSGSSEMKMETNSTAQVLHVSGGRGEVYYKMSDAAVWRRVGQGPWVPILRNVRSSKMELEQRGEIPTCRWELELQPRADKSRMRPLFTFLAVPQSRKEP
jgi:hypothetical protein